MTTSNTGNSNIKDSILLKLLQQNENQLELLRTIIDKKMPIRAVEDSASKRNRTLFGDLAQFTKLFKEELTDKLGYITGLNALRNKNNPEKTTDALLKALKKDNLTIANNTKNNVQRVISSQNNNIVNTNNTLPGVIAKYVSPQRNSTFDTKNIETDVAAEDEFIRKLSKAICKCIDDLGCGCEGGILPGPMPMPIPGRTPAPVPQLPVPQRLPLPAPQIPVPVPQRLPIPGRIPIPIPLPPLQLPNPISQRPPISLPAPATSNVPLLTDERLNQGMRTMPGDKIKEPVKVPIESVKAEEPRMGGPRNPNLGKAPDIIDVQAKEIPGEKIKPNDTIKGEVKGSKVSVSGDIGIAPGEKPGKISGPTTSLPKWATGWKLPGAISGIFTGYEMYQTEQAKNEGLITKEEANQRHGGSLGSLGGGLGGAALGAQAGAALGTVFLPGIGTVIGGVGGSILGGIAGAFGGQKAGEALVKQTQNLSNVDSEKNLSALQMYNANNENRDLNRQASMPSNISNTSVVPIDNSKTTNNYSSPGIRQDDPSLFSRQSSMWGFERRPIYG